jgi:glycosyltransferase involved in cell wall biosynthesis
MTQPLPVQSYWVVIPAYNEGATVRDVAARARRYCANVIVVDDGSTDDTIKVLAGLDISVLRNEQNNGKGGSLWCGFQKALARGAEAVITLDADGQHAPEEIPSFIGAALENPQAFVIGARRSEQRNASKWRYIANRVADFWISWAAGRPIKDSQSGFRLYPARLLQELAVKHGPQQSFVFESEVVIEAARRGVPVLFVPVTVAPRVGARASHFRPVVDILRITKMVAAKLLTKGLYPPGFYRAFIRCHASDGVCEHTEVRPNVRMVGLTNEEYETVSCASPAQEIRS